jgi:hypothetical protein
VNSAETSPGNHPQQNEEFYDAAPLEPHLIYQGEILLNIPLFVVPFGELGNRWLFLRHKGIPVHQAIKKGLNPNHVHVEALDSNKSDPWEDGTPIGDSVMGYLSKHPVLVLSQTCDVDTKKFIQVAPIYPTQDNNYVGKLMRDDVISAFWIRNHPPEWDAEMYADFEQIQAVHKSYRKQKLASGMSHFRLGQMRTLQLQRSITRYFGRPSGFDSNKDLAPRTATYLCLTCFHAHATVTKLDLEQNTPFVACELCGGTSWTIQLGSTK